MNEQEAIDVLKDDNTCIGTLNCDDEAYKKLTPAKEQAIAALEKQTPKKPILMQLKDYEIMCPACGVKEDRRTNCCPNCGQRYDWSD